MLYTRCVYKKFLSGEQTVIVVLFIQLGIITSSQKQQIDDKSYPSRAELCGACVCFPDESHSQAAVEEWELTRCVEDVYKVRTSKAIYQTLQ